MCRAGKDIETGQEPLFAWIRMSIRDVNPIMTPEPCYILVRINKPHIFWEMYRQRNCALRRTDALYPRRLSFEPIGDADRAGLPDHGSRATRFGWASCRAGDTGLARSARG